MKNFRKAALAIATASSVALTGTSVAAAEHDKTHVGPVYGSSSEANKEVGKVLGANKELTGEQAFGPFQQPNQPGWWILTKTLGFTAIIGAVAGLGIAVGNFLKNKGIII